MPLKQYIFSRLTSKADISIQSSALSKTLKKQQTCKLMPLFSLNVVSFGKICVWKIQLFYINMLFMLSCNGFIFLINKYILKIVSVFDKSAFDCSPEITIGTWIKMTFHNSQIKTNPSWSLC